MARVEVVEDFLSPELFERVSTSIPRPGAPGLQWKRSHHAHAEGKWWCSFPGEPLESALREMESRRGGGFYPDPRRTGGGLHLIERGGFLHPHYDFNRIGDRYRRANFILFIHPEWREEWGGHLDLFDQNLERFMRIPPKPNTGVIFETFKGSWHGHGEPLQTPPGVCRASLATYFYSNSRGGQEIEPHSTVYME